VELKDANRVGHVLALSLQAFGMEGLGTSTRRPQVETL